MTPGGFCLRFRAAIAICDVLCLDSRGRDQHHSGLVRPPRGALEIAIFVASRCLAQLTQQGFVFQVSRLEIIHGVLDRFLMHPQSFNLRLQTFFCLLLCLSNSNGNALHV